MNREILFRGKRFGDGEWVEGYFAKYRDFQNKVYTSILQFDKDDFGDAYCCGKVPVIPETVGQYTGLTDTNGKKIFEGDIVKTWKNNIGKIEFGQYWDEETEEDFYGYAWIGKDEYEESITLSLNNCWNGHEVIGNLHDNPELLEDEE